MKFNANHRSQPYQVLARVENPVGHLLPQFNEALSQQDHIQLSKLWDENADLRSWICGRMFTFSRTHSIGIDIEKQFQYFKKLATCQNVNHIILDMWESSPRLSHYIKRHVNSDECANLLANFTTNMIKSKRKTNRLNNFFKSITKATEKATIEINELPKKQPDLEGFLDAPLLTIEPDRETVPYEPSFHITNNFLTNLSSNSAVNEYNAENRFDNRPK